MSFKAIATLVSVLVSLPAHALTLSLSPAHDDHGQLTLVQPIADGGLLDFGPVALFNSPPRTGTLVPTGWGFWLLATFQIAVTGASRSTVVLARAAPTPGLRLRWANGNRTDWTGDGYGVDITGGDEIVARGDAIGGTSQIAMGIEDASGPGSKAATIFVSVLDQ